MNDIAVGVNLPDVHADPNAARERLSKLAADGFDCVEIRLDSFPLIIDGEVRREYVAVVQSLMRRHRFTYTAHIGRGVDLRDVARYELQKKALRSSIDVCGLLGIGLLVLHYEAKSTDLFVEQRFFDAHAEAAEYGARVGVALRIENIEVERVDAVVDFVQRMGRKDFLMNFDAGHAYLAAHRFHFDFLD